jgi:hypothetical protein
MQDQPGREVCFSRRVSLEERVRLLGVDRQRANGTKGSLEQIFSAAVDVVDFCAKRRRGN